MACVVAPFDHTLFDAAEEVRVTVFPEQKVVGPLVETVGVAGRELTVTTVPLDVAVHVPFAAVTE